MFIGTSNSIWFFIDKAILSLLAWKNSIKALYKKELATASLGVTITTAQTISGFSRYVFVAYYNYHIWQWINKWFLNPIIRLSTGTFCVHKSCFFRFNHRLQTNLFLSYSVRKTVQEFAALGQETNYFSSDFFVCHN